MIVLSLLDADKKELRRIDMTMALMHLVKILKNPEIETIVLGEVSEKGVEWERQFMAVTVMPSRRHPL